MTIVAVTGANGYIGMLASRAVSALGPVISLVRLPRHPGDRAWSLGMTEQEMTRILSSAGVTHIIHAAWDMRARSLEQLESVCILGTRRLLDAAKLAGVQHFIFISTISAFEGARSAYGKAKLATERLVSERGGLVLRLGLVYGNGNGGMFAGLSKLAARLPVIPLISGGPGYQFLLDERSLGGVIARAIRGDFENEQRPVTLACPEPVRLRDLMAMLAARQGRKVIFVSVPWRIIYFALQLTEQLSLNLRLSSDSLVSFVFQNPKPDFAPLADYDIHIVSFKDGSPEHPVARTPP